MRKASHDTVIARYKGLRNLISHYKLNIKSIARQYREIIKASSSDLLSRTNSIYTYIIFLHFEKNLQQFCIFKSSNIIIYTLLDWKRSRIFTTISCLNIFGWILELCISLLVSQENRSYLIDFPQQKKLLRTCKYHSICSINGKYQDNI